MRIKFIHKTRNIYIYIYDSYFFNFKSQLAFEQPLTSRLPRMLPPEPPASQRSLSTARRVTRRGWPVGCSPYRGTWPLTFHQGMRNVWQMHQSCRTSNWLSRTTKYSRTTECASSAKDLTIFGMWPLHRQSVKPSGKASSNVASAKHPELLFQTSQVDRIAAKVVEVIPALFSVQCMYSQYISILE